jgi:hypothetical protein
LHRGGERLGRDLSARSGGLNESPPMRWHILRLWLLISLATLLAGLLLAPTPVRAGDRFSNAQLVIPDGRGYMVSAWVLIGDDQIVGA